MDLGFKIHLLASIYSTLDWIFLDIICIIIVFKIDNLTMDFIVRKLHTLPRFYILCLFIKASLRNFKNFLCSLHFLEILKKELQNLERTANHYKLRKDLAKTRDIYHFKNIKNFFLKKSRSFRMRAV